MPNVTIQINGRPYSMACAPGEEEQLQTIAKALDREVVRVRASAGDVGEVRLLVMAGLMLSDRAEAAEERVQALEAELAGISSQEATAGAREARAASLLALAAARLEEIVRE
jgi:cell division protein ZapA